MEEKFRNLSIYICKTRKKIVSLHPQMIKHEQQEKQYAQMG